MLSISIGAINWFPGLSLYDRFTFQILEYSNFRWLYRRIRNIELTLNWRGVNIVKLMLTSVNLIKNRLSISDRSTDVLNKALSQSSTYDLVLNKTIIYVYYYISPTLFTVCLRYIFTWIFLLLLIPVSIHMWSSM